MKALFFSLTAAICLTANAQRTNIMNLGTYGVPPPILTLPYSKLVLFERAVDRVAERADARLVHRLTLDMLDAAFPEEPFEFGVKRGKSLIFDGFQYSLREWGLATPAYAWLDERFEQVGNWFSSFWRDTLSANVERNNTQSPAEIGFLEERARFRGLKKGVRPFSRSPYAFIGYGWRDKDRVLFAESTLRLSLRHFDEPTLSFVTEIPIRNWSLGFGLEARAGGNREEFAERNGRIFSYIDRPFDVTFGLKGRLAGGLVHIGADVLGERAVAVWRRSH